MSGSQKKNNTDNIVYMGRNLPVVSVIDITWSMLLSCNYSCEYCSIRSHDKQYATPDTVKKNDSVHREISAGNQECYAIRRRAYNSS